MEIIPFTVGAAPTESIQLKFVYGEWRFILDSINLTIDSDNLPCRNNLVSYRSGFIYQVNRMSVIYRRGQLMVNGVQLMMNGVLQLRLVAIITNIPHDSNEFRWFTPSIELFDFDLDGNYIPRDDVEENNIYAMYGPSFAKPAIDLSTKTILPFPQISEIYAEQRKRVLYFKVVLLEPEAIQKIYTNPHGAILSIQRTKDIPRLMLDQVNVVTQNGENSSLVIYNFVLDIHYSDAVEPDFVLRPIDENPFIMVLRPWTQ